ncbi:MAG: YqiA/YcfP family alpha/beta fold hydrolase [Bdellovibrionales bacterium]
MKDCLIYLHGFNSSNHSPKAQIAKSLCDDRKIKAVIPQLAYYPQKAMDQVEAIIDSNKDLNYHFIGSSLGGYMATYLANKYQRRAALINPAIDPAAHFSEYLGEHTHDYTKEKFILEKNHLQELENLKTPSLQSPENFWVLLKSGDEVLDYRLAVEKFNNSFMTLDIGGDHSFSNFEEHCPDMIDWLFR